MSDGKTTLPHETSWCAQEQLSFPQNGPLRQRKIRNMNTGILFVAGYAVTKESRGSFPDGFLWIFH
jgi:hypothetical protein